MMNEEPTTWDEWRKLPHPEWYWLVGDDPEINTEED